jgi:hypothetical protein
LQLLLLLPLLLLLLPLLLLPLPLLLLLLLPGHEGLGVPAAHSHQGGRDHLLP